MCVYKSYLFRSNMAEIGDLLFDRVLQWCHATTHNLQAQNTY